MAVVEDDFRANVVAVSHAVSTAECQHVGSVFRGHLTATLLSGLCWEIPVVCHDGQHIAGVEGNVAISEAIMFGGGKCRWSKLTNALIAQERVVGIAGEDEVFRHGCVL